MAADYMPGNIFRNSIIVLATLFSFNQVCSGTSPDSAKADSSVVEINYNDGPHVFWKDDTSAVIFYLCENTIDSLTIYGHDTIHFKGFCDDTDIEYVIPVGQRGMGPYKYENVSKVLSISDVHGEYEHFIDILTKSGVIDSSLSWIWGDGHLVINGDVFDRGDMVTECLWLIYLLEIQARKHGGRVHFTLGNHELMILQADNRYIHEKYLKGIVRRTRIDHKDLFGPDMELGRWLRTKHTAITIDDILFVHGGIAPYFIGRDLNIEKLNSVVRGKIDLRSSQIAFDTTAKFLFGSRGPFWYRGYHYKMENRYPLITDAGIDSLLAYYGVKAIVVGHTEVEQVTGLFDNKIYAIDIPVDALGGFQALLYENGLFYRIAEDGRVEILK